MERKKVPLATEKMLEYKKGHVEIGPTGQKLLYCPHEGCDKVLTSSPGLRYHIRTHCGNDRPYQCTRCKKTFKSANGLKYHTEKTRCEISVDVTSYIGGRAVRINEDSYQDDDVEVDVVSTTQPVDIQSWRQRNTSSSSFLTLSPTPYALGLDHKEQEDIVDPLTQLAIIATGPQSPLLHQNQTLTAYQRASQNFNASIHSYAKPPRNDRKSLPIISRKRSLSFSGPERKYSSNSSGHSLSSDEESRHGDTSSTSVSSEVELDIDQVSDTSEDDNNNDLSSSWPKAKWQCFVAGSRVRIENGIITDWQRVEDDFEEKYLDGTYAPHGLRLVKFISKSPILHLVFKPVQDSENSALFAQCQMDHPFFVKDKGWCSCFPSLTEEHYQLQTSSLEVNDVCLPPNHPDASFTRKAVRSLTSLQFTPEDSTAVFALSQMARSRRETSSNERLSRSLPKTLGKSKKQPMDMLHYKALNIRAKRPMNAFMLFAKKFRLEYTQMYPGKDNRAISVLLGDHWKKMKSEERKAFSQQAKQLAEQYRKQNPDCWKRKRSISEEFI